MQASDTKKLLKRSRYYQGMIDLQLIDKGQKYNKLNRGYVIFICLKDMFEKGRHIYTFENICKEDKNISLGDETTKIFLNASGKMDDVSKELKAFLDCVLSESIDKNGKLLQKTGGERILSILLLRLLITGNSCDFAKNRI